MKRKHLTNSEIERFKRVLKAECTPEITLLSVLLNTGLRAEELLKLTPNHFTPSWAEVNLTHAAKGSNVGYFLIDDLTQSSLKAHFAHCPTTETLADHLWPELNCRSQYKRLYTAWKRLSLKILESGTRGLGLHCFRHTVARLIYEQTKDLKLTQEILRHKSLSSTEHYLPAFRFNEARTLLYSQLKTIGGKK